MWELFEIMTIDKNFQKFVGQGSYYDYDDKYFGFLCFMIVVTGGHAPNSFSSR